MESHMTGMVHNFDPSIQGRGRPISEFEASLIYLQRVFQDSQEYTEKP